MGNEISEEYDDRIDIDDVAEQINNLSEVEKELLSKKLNINYNNKKKVLTKNDIKNIPKKLTKNITNNLIKKTDNLNESKTYNNYKNYNNFVNKEYNNQFNQFKNFKNINSINLQNSIVEQQKLNQKRLIHMQNVNNPNLKLYENPYILPKQQSIHPAFPDPYKEQQELKKMREKMETNELSQFQPFQIKEQKIKQIKIQRKIKKKKIKDAELKKKQQKEELVKQFMKINKSKKIYFNEEELSALKILKLDKNYTLDELKKSYKLIALSTHPDKGGSKTLFFIVTKAYKTLLKSIKKRTKENTFIDLKNNFQEFQEQKMKTQHLDFDLEENSDLYKKKELIDSSRAKQSFNLNKFNQVYNDNKLEDETEEGYEKWIIENQPEETTDNPKLFKKFNKRHFHNRFQKDKDKKTGTEIIKYEEPKPMSISNKLKYVELGAKKKGDFTKSVNINYTGGVGYTDYKKAHTELLINPNIVKKRKKFKSVRDYKEKRKNISYQMSEKDKLYYKKKKELEEKHELDRLRRLDERDHKAKIHFEKVNKLMLGL